MQTLASTEVAVNNVLGSSLPDFTSEQYKDAYSRINAIVIEGEKEAHDNYVSIGTLIPDKAEELKGWGDDLSKLKAPLGVYSVLGNHDYGEYTSWKSESEKIKNFNDLIKGQKEFGWNLLRNQNDFIEVDGQKLNIIGVENWASSRFQQ